MKTLSFERATEVFAIAETLFKELRFGIFALKLKGDLRVVNNYESAELLKEIFKDSITQNFDDEQIDQLAYVLRGGRSSVDPTITPKYRDALQQVADSVLSTLNDQSAKEAFVADRLDEDDFKLDYGLEPGEFYDAARELLGAVCDKKSHAAEHQK